MKRISGMFGAFNGELCFRAKDSELEKSFFGQLFMRGWRGFRDGVVCGCCEVGFGRRLGGI